MSGNKRSGYFKLAQVRFAAIEGLAVDFKVIFGQARPDTEAEGLSRCPNQWQLENAAHEVVLAIQNTEVLGQAVRRVFGGGVGAVFFGVWPGVRLRTSEIEQATVCFATGCAFPGSIPELVPSRINEFVHCDFPAFDPLIWCTNFAIRAACWIARRSARQCALRLSPLDYICVDTRSDIYCFIVDRI